MPWRLPRAPRRRLCVGAMIHARVGRVVFAAHDLKTGACGSALNLPEHPSHNHRLRVEGGRLVVGFDMGAFASCRKLY